MKIESYYQPTNANHNRPPLKNVSLQKRPAKSNVDQLLKVSPLSANLLDPIVFKRRDTTKSNGTGWTHKKSLTVETIFSDSESGSTSGETDNLVDSDYASLSVTPAASDRADDGATHDFQCCVWDWRTTHIGAFPKKIRLNNLKRRLDALCSTKSLPVYEADIGRLPNQKQYKRSKYDPRQELFVTDVSHRSRRCVTFRKRRYIRLMGPAHEGMLQKVQVPLDATFNEPKVEFTPDSQTYVIENATRCGLTKQQMALLKDSKLPLASEDIRLKVHRVQDKVTDYIMNVEDGQFWRQLNLVLWSKRHSAGIRCDENNDRLSVIPMAVLTKPDFAYVLSLLETVCFNEIHTMLLEILSVPNHAENDNAFCEICQSEASDQNDPIVFCEGCNLAVHQHCFGITVLPKKDWYCKVCTTLGKKAEVRCRFCPLSWGTMKQTIDNGWAHFACAVWQQSLRFDDLTTYEPISHEWDLNTDSFLKICSVCDLCYGSCICCSVPSCKISFHPTCGLRSGLYMFIEDSSKSKYGVKLFSFCAYHSEKARSVRNSTNNRMEFILEQMNMGNNNSIVECYKKSHIGCLENSFEQFVDWQKLADDLNLPRDIMELIVEHWIKRRRIFNNRPLVDLYEANENFISSRFREELNRPSVKRPFELQADDEEMEEMVREYAKAHCILDKFRNLATLTLRREKLKLQLVLILKESFEASAGHLETDSHLGNRFLEKVAVALHEHIHGPGNGDVLLRRSVSVCDDKMNENETMTSPRRKRSRSGANSTEFVSPKSRRTAKFSHPFSKIQQLFADLFDNDENLVEDWFNSLPDDCV